MLKFCLTLATMTISYVAFSQQRVEMADGMRSEGKIYVVVAILVLILLGLVTYLFLLDKKMGKLEKRIGEHDKGSDKP